MLTASLLVLFAASAVAAQGAPYAQCGGIGWTGATTCTNGWACLVSNPYYSQCLPASSSTSKAVTTSPPSSTASSSSKPASSATLTGLAATAPTTPPSKAVGQLPALGWNSWNAYGCDVSEAKVVAAAQAFVSLGLKTAGYSYVNIDDCWALKSRDSSGRIVPDPSKFPTGINGTAAQVHALGLKLGIYSDAGTNTCAGFPGSLGTEILDAATWASWGVDYLKYDNCYVPGNWSDASTPQGGDWYNSNSAIRYRQMGAALAAQSRPFQFSLCIWGDANVWTWGARVGHSWRMSGDSSATWSYITSIISTVVQHPSAGFGGHNDLDMMEIGNGNLTISEQRTHFGAWAMLKSPILLGTDLSLLSAAQIAIITNAELLAFSQDATVGPPAKPFTASSGAPTTSPPEYYSGTSSKGTHVFIINTGGSTATKTFNFANVPGLSGSSFKVHNMWTGQDVSGTFTTSYSTSLAAHDFAAFLISKA